ncbi:MAG: hypothetical protein Q9220_002132 [cf. Caloplaca sp. 1 TL-2023]
MSTMLSSTIASPTSDVSTIHPIANLSTIVDTLNLASTTFAYQLIGAQTTAAGIKALCDSFDLTRLTQSGYNTTSVKAVFCNSASAFPDSVPSVEQIRGRTLHFSSLIWIFQAVGALESDRRKIEILCYLIDQGAASSVGQDGALVKNTICDIDPEPPTSGPHSLTAAKNQIALLLPSPSHLSSTPHPLLPPLAPSNPTPLAESENLRIARHEPLTGIDTSRYELSPSSPSSSTTNEQLAQGLKEAYTSSTYLRLRSQQLALLDTYGKNSWLMSNSQLESLLESVERELQGTQESVKDVNRERKRVQEAGRGEMEGLEGGWRGGVGRVVEGEVAVMGLEDERRGRLREGAVGR